LLCREGNEKYQSVHPAEDMYMVVEDFVFYETGPSNGLCAVKALLCPGLRKET
jgi:hypothetical protein